MIELTFIADSIEPGAAVTILRNGVPLDVQMVLADIPDDALHTAAGRMADAIDAAIITRLLRGD